jgi:hypothetical protein
MAHGTSVERCVKPCVKLLLALPSTKSQWDITCKYQVLFDEQPHACCVDAESTLA